MLFKTNFAQSIGLMLDSNPHLATSSMIWRRNDTLEVGERFRRFHRHLRADALCPSHPKNKTGSLSPGSPVKGDLLLAA
jgi:hypothetical protein